MQFKVLYLSEKDAKDRVFDEPGFTPANIAIDQGFVCILLKKT